MNGMSDGRLAAPTLFVRLRQVSTRDRLPAPKRRRRTSPA